MANAELNERNEREMLVMYNTEEILPLETEEDSGKNSVTADQIRKMHVHLAHLDTKNVIKMLKMPNQSFGEELVKTAVGQCACIKQNVPVQKPIVTRYVPDFCGHTICSDIMYPLDSGKRQNPYIVISCALSRFVIAKPLTAITPENVSQAIATHWIMYYGRCRILLTDKGPGYTGAVFENFCCAWSINHVTCSTHASFSNGLIERQVALVKYGFKCAYLQSNGQGAARVMDQAVLARNLIPSMSTGITPLMAMTGREDIFAGFEKATEFQDLKTMELGGVDEGDRAMRNIRNVFRLRTILIARDARLIVETCTKRNLRAGAKDISRPGESIEVYLPTAKKWVGNHRFGAKSGNHCFVECGNRVFKHPLCWTRPPFRMDEIEVPNQSEWKVGEEEADPSSSSGQQEPVVDVQYYGETMDEQVELTDEIVDDNRKRRNPEFRVERMNENFQMGELSPTAGKTKGGQERCASTSEEEELAIIGNADPPRLPPRIYIRIEGCVQAIIKEMAGLTRTDQRGIPSLLAVHVNHKRYNKLPLAHSVLIVKEKNPATYKARLCVRGDELKGKPTSTQPLLHHPGFPRRFCWW